MKIAIHHRHGSFSDRWIKYCEKNNIDYKLVDAFDNNIVEQLQDCNIFMWHHHHSKFKDVLTAKRVLFALEHAGVKVFPDFKTSWHFDDKVAQKYLLEAIGAPLVPSYIFYDKKQALTWVKKTTYPKVFKLKGGAGASNVKLVNTYREAVCLINKSFGSGFKQYNSIEALKERLRKFKKGEESIIGILKGLLRILFPTDFSRKQPSEKDYIYFQDFIPNNNSDIRVIIIGEKAFAIRRMVRENDFRASGSGQIDYSNNVNEKCLELAFDVHKKIKSQCTAFDFIFNDNGEPLIVEISYGFSMLAYDNCPGYWSIDKEWHEGVFNPQEWIIENLIK